MRLPDLTGALDCDLGLCPLTNTMPILREGLVGPSGRTDGRSVKLTMAWVSVPDLCVSASEQVYRADAAPSGEGALVGFSAGDFATLIEVDADGIVASYPGIGRRIGLDG
ncbi:MAG: hypothetical protein GEV03_14860 [Streptosporangiales bacterium]|nr:hypothetical protein [Streptosporangiales bacterium]